MPGDYRTLAQIHHQIGLGAFAAAMTSRLIDFAQRNDWLGRQIIDLGCGTGASLEWMTRHGYIVTGVDRSAEMLAISKEALSGHSVRLMEQDIRSVEGIADMDMALALDVMHEFGNLRELEETFKAIAPLVKTGKMFIFDIYTIEGLVERGQRRDSLEYDNNGLTIFIQNQYDYERQIQKREYIIFRQENKIWQRQQTFRILRAYPVQGVIGLVQRCGFEVLHVLNTEFSPHTPTDSTPRVIIYAQKR